MNIEIKDIKFQKLFYFPNSIYKAFTNNDERILRKYAKLRQFCVKNLK